MVILFSGDTGFYSGCGKLYETLKGRSDSSVRIYPGISSVSYFAALTGYSYQSAEFLHILFSGHQQKCFFRKTNGFCQISDPLCLHSVSMEKIKAAGAEGITACVIGNPEKQNRGDSFAQVCRKISEITGKTIKNHIFLIGIGMGNAQTLTMEAAEKIREADYIFGAKRLLRTTKNEQAVRYPYYLAADISQSWTGYPAAG